MTCTDTHPHRPDLRRRADRLLAALDAAPAPQTLPDIIRSARALMIIDRLLGQLWTALPARSGRRPTGEPADAAPTDPVPDDTHTPVTANAQPPNRHQRRQQAAQSRGTRPDANAQPHRETG